MIRLIFLLLFVSGSLVAQEIYPGQIPCFCVTNLEVNFGGQEKAWKVEATAFSFVKCSPSTTYTINFSPTIKIRDTTNAAYAATDYYNQAANDSINLAIRAFASASMPSLGSEDDIGFLFNTRLKDPPPVLGCNPIVHPVYGQHATKIMLAIETANGNYRQGTAPAARRIGVFLITLKFYVGAVVNTTTLQYNDFTCSPTGPPSCPVNCNVRYGANPPTSALFGYFTEKSVSRIWRNNRNVWKFQNGGFWPGQLPYTGYLKNGSRRCATFGTYTCSDLSLAQNNAIADIAIASGTQGECQPECGSCDQYDPPWFNIKPYQGCPSATSGFLYLRNPNPSMTGSWRVLENNIQISTGSLPDTNILVKDPFDATAATKDYIVQLIRPSCGDTIFMGMYNGSFVRNASRPCDSVPIYPAIGHQFIPGSCYRFQSSYAINKFAINSQVDSFRFYNSLLGITPYTEYQPILANNLPRYTSSLGFYLVRVYMRGSYVDLTYFSIKSKCPCATNRYLEFNNLGIDLIKKTTLEDMGWTVLP